MADNVVIAALAVAALLYAHGIARIHDMTQPAQQRRRHHVAAFAGATGATLLVVSPPFDRAAHETLSAHMLQHIVLLGVVPPLLAVSAPLTVILSALPQRTQRLTRPHVRRLVRSQSQHWGTWMAASFGIAMATMVAWHLPGPYDAAVRNDAVHALEHSSFVLTATLFWWMALGAGRPARRGAAVVVVFVSSLPATALGVLMVLATTSWYEVYGTDASAVRDQTVAGAVMWGFGSLALVASAAALFAGWLAAMDRVQTAAALHRTPDRW